MKHEEEDKAERGPSGLQRTESSSKKQQLRNEILAIRQGHTTGGYCDTEKLHAKEKLLDKVLRKELKEAIEKHGYSPDPRFKHRDVREVEVELNGLSWKPTLVVKED